MSDDAPHATDDAASRGRAASSAFQQDEPASQGAYWNEAEPAQASEAEPDAADDATGLDAIDLDRTEPDMTDLDETAPDAAEDGGDDEDEPVEVVFTPDEAFTLEMGGLAETDEEAEAAPGPAETRLLPFGLEVGELARRESPFPRQDGRSEADAFFRFRRRLSQELSAGAEAGDPGDEEKDGAE